MLCVFVAGLEFVSEIFVSGVEVGGDMGDGKGKEERRMNGKAEVKANGHGHGANQSNGMVVGKKND